MNTKLLKHIATDCAIILPLIYFGAYEKHEIVESAMQFFFWALSSMALLTALLASELKKQGLIKAKKRTKAHFAYANFSACLKACALFTSGYSVLAVVYLITGLLFNSTAQELAK